MLKITRGDFLKQAGIGSFLALFTAPLVLAELVNPTATSEEIYDHCKLLAKDAKKRGVKNITIKAKDFRKLDDFFHPHQKHRDLELEKKGCNNLTICGIPFIEGRR